MLLHQQNTGIAGNLARGALAPDSFGQEMPNSPLKLQQTNLSEYSARANLGTFKGLDAASFSHA